MFVSAKLTNIPGCDQAIASTRRVYEKFPKGTVFLTITRSMSKKFRLVRDDEPPVVLSQNWGIYDDGIGAIKSTFFSKADAALHLAQIKPLASDPQRYRLQAITPKRDKTSGSGAEATPPPYRAEEAQ